MTSYGYIIMIIVDSCKIRFHFDCIMELKKSKYNTTNVCSRKSATPFGDLPDWLWLLSECPNRLRTISFLWSLANNQTRFSVYSVSEWSIKVWIMTLFQFLYYNTVILHIRLSYCQENELIPNNWMSQKCKGPLSFLLLCHNHLTYHNVTHNRVFFNYYVHRFFLGPI